MSTMPDSGFQHDAEEDMSLQQLSDAFARRDKGASHQI
jgi:hypothetical protein